MIYIHEEGVHVLTSDNHLEFRIVSECVSGFELWELIKESWWGLLGIRIVIVWVEGSIVNVLDDGQVEGG